MFNKEIIEAIDRTNRERNRTPDQDLLDAFFRWMYESALTEDRLTSLEAAAANCIGHRHHDAMTYAALKLFLDFAKMRDLIS